MENRKVARPTRFERVIFVFGGQEASGLREAERPVGTRGFSRKGTLRADRHPIRGRAPLRH